METQAAGNEQDIPDEWMKILEYMERYPSFYFSSARLARVFQSSSQKMSKVLLTLSARGILEKRQRGRSRIYSKIKILNLKSSGAIPCTRTGLSVLSSLLSLAHS